MRAGTRGVANISRRRLLLLCLLAERMLARSASAAAGPQGPQISGVDSGAKARKLRSRSYKLAWALHMSSKAWSSSSGSVTGISTLLGHVSLRLLACGWRRAAGGARHAIAHIIREHAARATRVLDERAPMNVLVQSLRQASDHAVICDLFHLMLRFVFYTPSLFNHDPTRHVSCSIGTRQIYLTNGQKTLPTVRNG